VLERGDETNNGGIEMTTGYDQSCYNDISRISNYLQSIAMDTVKISKSLETLVKMLGEKK